MASGDHHSDCGISFLRSHGSNEADSVDDMVQAICTIVNLISKHSRVGFGTGDRLTPSFGTIILVSKCTAMLRLLTYSCGAILIFATFRDGVWLGAGCDGIEQA